MNIQTVLIDNCFNCILRQKHISSKMHQEFYRNEQTGNWIQNLSYAEWMWNDYIMFSMQERSYFNCVFKNKCRCHCKNILCIQLDRMIEEMKKWFHASLNRTSYDYRSYTLVNWVMRPDKSFILHDWQSKISHVMFDYVHFTWLTKKKSEIA